MEFADKTIAIATEQGFFLWRAYAMCGRGWARATRGDYDGGVTEIEEGISFLRRIRMSLSLTQLGTLLPEVYLCAGRFEEGLRAVDELLAASETSVNTRQRPEHLRLKGELLAAQSGRKDAGVPWYEQAIELAREHGAAYDELLAATSLSRARRAMGDAGSACAVLREAVTKIHEGFDIPAYIEAAALLRELDGEA
jgi:tetratricopeptide (TPR) repeat protein